MKELEPNQNNQQEDLTLIEQEKEKNLIIHEEIQNKDFELFKNVEIAIEACQESQHEESSSNEEMPEEAEIPDTLEVQVEISKENQPINPVVESKALQSNTLNVHNPDGLAELSAGEVAQDMMYLAPLRKRSSGHFFGHSSIEGIEQKSKDEKGKRKSSEDSVKSVGFFLQQDVQVGAQCSNFPMNSKGLDFNSSQFSNDMDQRSHIKQEASIYSNELISNFPESTSQNSYFMLLADYALGNLKRLHIFKFPKQVAAMLEEVQKLDPAVLKVLCLNIATVAKSNHKIIDLFWGKLLNTLNDESKVPLYKDILEASLETLYSSLKITMDEAGYWQNFRKKRDVFLAYYKKLSTKREYEKLFLKYEKEPIDESEKEEIFSKFNTYYIKNDDEGHTKNVGIGEFWTKNHPIIIEAIKNLTDENFIALTKRVLNNGKQAHTFFKTFFTAISNDLEIVDKPSYQKAVEECRALINIKKDDLCNQLQGSLKNEENKPYKERNAFESNIRNHLKSWEDRLITLNNVSPKMIIKINSPTNPNNVLKKRVEPFDCRLFNDEPETQEAPLVKQYKTEKSQIDLLNDTSAFNFKR